MAEQRLPIVNDDDGFWGDILNQYIGKEHYNGDTDLVQATSENGGHKAVTLQPGTTSAGTAPLKFMSGGSLMTNPEAGAVEFNSDNLYFTQTTGPTRKAIATLDSNSNITVNNTIEGYTTNATAAGTTTLTVSSDYMQYFTGSTTQTVAMPVTSTLVLGQQWQIVNNSTGVVTVNSSGANKIVALSGGSRLIVTCILTSGTDAASWSYVVFEKNQITIGSTEPTNPNTNDIWIDTTT